MKWELIFSNYKLACYYLYKWYMETKKNSDTNTVPLHEFNEGAFFNALIEKGYLNNEERTFEFFDYVLIYCYVMPLEQKTFRASSQSNSRVIVCNDCFTRQEAAIRALENAFILLQERELGRKKLKAATVQH